MIPKLPSFPEGNQPIRSIAPDWLRALWRCVQFAMTHPTGDNRTIFRNGELLSTNGSGSALADGGSGSYNGPFAVNLEAENQIRVKGGFALRNGNMLQVNEAVIPVQNGFICCCCYFDEDAKKWLDPVIDILETVTEGAYPVGQCIVEDDGSIRLESFYTPLAVIIVAKRCPLAVQNG